MKAYMYIKRSVRSRQFMNVYIECCIQTYMLLYITCARYFPHCKGKTMSSSCGPAVIVCSICTSILNTVAVSLLGPLAIKHYELDNSFMSAVHVTTSNLLAIRRLCPLNRGPDSNNKNNEIAHKRFVDNNTRTRT